LLITYIGLENFIKIIVGLPRHGQIVSCVIQVDPVGSFVSHSGFEHVFDAIAGQREEEDVDLIIASMNESGFAATNRVVFDLPNGKQFVRLDFIAV